MRTTNIRFTGLASGLDTESMVTAMVMPYKNKVDNAVQQQKLLELKKDAWKEMNNKVYSFFNDTLSSMRLEGSYNKKEITISQPGLIEVSNSGSFPEGTHKVTVEQLAEGATVSTEQIAVGEEGKNTLLKKLGIDPGTTITITTNKGESTITVTEETTIADFEKSLKDVGVNASFDEKTGAFFISSKETGANQTIEFSVSGGTDVDVVMKALGINRNIDENGNDKGYKFEGKDAEITYNGLTVTSATNAVTVNGMQINLISAEPGKEITVVAKQDTEAMVDMVLNFVNEYNTLIDEINTKVNAAYNKDYMPLTDEQKADMSEDEIRLWNAKVEASILRKDPSLQALASSMRDIISNTTYTKNDGTTGTLASFGITTTSNYKDGGKLEIDEEKLRATLNEDPDGFVSIFTGVGKNLYDDINKKLQGSTLSSSNYLFNDKELDKRISDQKTQVSKLEERLLKAEDMYYAKFTAMEKALSQLNNQSSWFASQLG